MTLIEFSALAQSGVLSAIAVILCVRSPAIWQAYLTYVQEKRRWEAEQSFQERKFRHDLANVTAVSLADLTVVIHELRDAVGSMCKFKG